METIKQTIPRLANTMSNVLITGESGTGKEVVARAIHFSGVTHDRPFIAVNCGGLADTLVESELFGYRKGTFTGAESDRPGYFESADGGTLFLDEIGDLPAAMQVKLLRVLEQKKIERLGGEQSFKVDVRLISATHVDLEARIKEGTFREDLFYRLNVITIVIPPLRERREDILPLVEHFLANQRTRLGKQISGLTREARDFLFYYSWPGNVRELENVIERACVLCRGDAIEVDLLPRLVKEDKPSTEAAATPASHLLRDVERTHIEKVLVEADWNFRQAALLLGIHRNTLRMKIREYGLERRAP
jgi:transcriptional regulator with PAS, ATPase and Fis domain